MRTESQYPLWIEVTVEDIRGGKKFDVCGCPVSQAIYRAFQGRAWVEASYSHLHVSLPGAAWAMLTPESVRRWMANFDAGQPVEPFRFRLLVPEEVLHV